MGAMKCAINPAPRNLRRDTGKNGTINQERRNIMSTRYSGKAFKDSSQMKTAKLSTKEKRKLKKKKNKTISEQSQDELEPIISTPITSPISDE